MKIKEKNIVMEYLDNKIRITYTPNILRKEEKKVRRALLKIPASANNQDGFLVKINNELVDKFYENGSNGIVCLDISNPLQETFDNNEINLNVEIENANSINFIVNGEVEILLDCINKRYGLKKSSELEKQINKKIISNININDGSIKVSHSDFMGISHEYNSLLTNNIDGENVNVTLTDNGCGNKWKLNLEQYLIKDEQEDDTLSDRKSSARYIYVDGSGNEHEFLDRYYYLENEEKKYIDASEVSIDSDGKLSYAEKEVQQEIISEVEGLTLITGIENFKGKELIEAEHENIEALKKEMDILERNIRNYDNQLSINKWRQTCIDKKKNIDTLNTNITDCNLLHENYNIGIQNELIDLKTIYIDNYKIYRDKMHMKAYNNDVTYDVSEEEAKRLSDEAQEDIEILNVQSMQENNRIRSAVANFNQQLKTANLDYLDIQNEIDKYQLFKEEDMLEGEIEYYLKEYNKKRAELEYLEKRLPCYYLVDENNNILGFAKSEEDKIYRLSFVNDETQNGIYLEYDDNKLKRVKNENKEITFEYKDEKLVSIKDVNNNKIKYEYEEGNLVKIKYDSRRYIKFSYDEEGNLISVKNQNEKGYCYEYLNKKVVRVNKVSKEREKLEKEITYIDYKTTELRDDKGQLRTYIFNNDGELVTVYENKLINEDVIGNVEIISHEVRIDNKMLSLSSLNYTSDLLEGINYNNELFQESESYLGGDAILGDTSLVSINGDNEDAIMIVDSINNKLEKVITRDMLETQTSAKKLILSGWAKANSATLNKKINADGKEENEIDKLLNESEDNYKRGRKFELRAEVTYLNDNEARKEEFVTSYDDLNSNWQYAVVGITISEDSNDILQDIKLIFDYSNNINEAEFTKMILKEGAFEYKEYDGDNNLVYYKDNLENETRYEYEDNLLVKETLIKDSKEYVSEYFYNKEDKIKRIEYKFNNLVKEYKYNENGELVKEYVYYKFDPSLKIYENEIEDTKILNSYGYEEKDIVLLGYKEDELVSYRKDNTNNNIEYDENENLIKLTHNDFDYKYSYDDFDNLIKIEIEDDLYLEKEYNEDLRKVTTRYVNGDTYITYYNDNEDVVRVEYNKDGNSQTLLEHTYDTYNNLTSSKDLINNVTYTYKYDKYNNVIEKKYNSNYLNVVVSYEYNKDNKIIKESITENESVKEIEYDYDEVDNLVKINLLNGKEENIKYDTLNRIKEVNLSGIYNKQYGYLINNGHSGNLIDEEEFIKDNVILDRYKYEYDNNLNIVNIKKNNKEEASYSYDELNRLVKEDNKALNKIIRYTYDNGGNILYKEENDIVHEYKYGVSGNKDRLLSYDGKLFSYDMLGNPNVYKDKSLVWDKNRLTRYENVTFTYNEFGLRTSKIKDNVITKYYYDENKLKRQDNGNILDFEYDVSGVIGFNYNNVGSYYYKKNILGDIIAILDSNDVEIVRYVYDGYGNHKSYVLNNNEYVDIDTQVSYTSDGLNNKVICEINPFRYRSYYYDVETKLYYLLSRYYDPEICRFVSADDISQLDKDTLNGLNLYAYCLNDPINNVDPSGDASFKWYHWLAIGIGAVLSLGASGVLIAAASGAISGATLASTTLIGAARGILVGAAMGTYAGLGVNTIYTGMKQNALAPKDMLMAVAKGAAIGFGFGAVVGALVGSVQGFLSYIPDKVGGFTEHGWAQLRGRDGGIGVKYSEVKKAIAEPVKIVSQKYGLRYKFIGENATVVLNKFKKIVTTWATTKAGCRFPKEKAILIWFGLQALFNNED